jgi:hypothetical protein
MKTVVPINGGLNIILTDAQQLTEVCSQMDCEEITKNVLEHGAFRKHNFFIDHGVTYISDYRYTLLQTQFIHNDASTVNLFNDVNFENAPTLNF